MKGADGVPSVRFVHIDEIPTQEVKAQQHGDRRVAIKLKFLEHSPERAFIYTRYDPGIVVERHGHRSDHAIFITGGSVTIGDVECTPGMLVILDEGATFGPLVAGPEGTELLEFYAGDLSPVPADPAGFAKLLKERGITPLDVA
jgi:hypothetical protein